jgi:hypothetical protein
MGQLGLTNGLIGL